MIEFRDVSFSYNHGKVLQGISFSARFSEKIAILGPSGEGKTTILRLILGLLRPDGGRVLIGGTDITDLPEPELREIRTKFTIVFQEGALFDSLSVQENVVFCLRERRGLPEAEIEARARELLRRVGIEEAIGLMPEELSGGMQRRAAIARSLCSCEPVMMLYDEPTTGLDPAAADNICRLINDLSSGEPPERKGIIIVTHDVAAAVKVAERFLYLRAGRVVFDGDLSALKGTEDPGLREFIKGILK